MLESKGLVVDEEQAIPTDEETSGIEDVEAVAEKPKKKKKLKNKTF